MNLTGNHLCILCMRMQETAQREHLNALNYSSTPASAPVNMPAGECAQTQTNIPYTRAHRRVQLIQIKFVVSFGSSLPNHNARMNVSGQPEEYG